MTFSSRSSGSKWCSGPLGLASCPQTFVLSVNKVQPSINYTIISLLVLFCQKDIYHKVLRWVTQWYMSLVNSHALQVDANQIENNKHRLFTGSVAVVVTVTLRAMLRRFLKKSGEAWLSPPSAWIGSITIPATGLPFCLHFTIRSSTWRCTRIMIYYWLKLLKDIFYKTCLP